jgi:hypothetical protein
MEKKKMSMITVGILALIMFSAIALWSFLMCGRIIGFILVLTCGLLGGFFFGATVGWEDYQYQIKNLKQELVDKEI